VDLDVELGVGLQLQVGPAVQHLGVERVHGLLLPVQPLGGVDVAGLLVDQEEAAGPVARQDVLHVAFAAVHVGVKLKHTRPNGTDGNQARTRGKVTVLKWFLKRRCGSTKNHHLYRFFEELFKEMVLIKDPRLKGSLWNQKWCLKEPFVEGSLRHLYRFFEEHFKKMVLKKPWFEKFFVEPGIFF